MSKEICQRCGEKDYDRRTLWIACFYAMQELEIPFVRELLFHTDFRELKKSKKPFQHKDIVLQSGTFKTKGELTPQEMYTLRVCKDCRADWMQAIKMWFKTKPIRESCGSGIFVRRNGASVEITEEEWYENNPGREPVRVKP